MAKSTSPNYGNDSISALKGAALDELKEAEYQGGPFENNLESARAYLLKQSRRLQLSPSRLLRKSRSCSA